MMEAVTVFETLVNVYEKTWRNISQDCNLHTFHSENQTSQHYIGRVIFNYVTLPSVCPWTA
jgi:hypothetical protein